jgi:hypothetical protein
MFKSNKVQQYKAMLNQFCTTEITNQNLTSTLASTILEFEKDNHHEP